MFTRRKQARMERAQERFLEGKDSLLDIRRQVKTGRNLQALYDDIDHQKRLDKDRLTVTPQDIARLLGRVATSEHDESVLLATGGSKPFLSRRKIRNYLKVAQSLSFDQGQAVKAWGASAARTAKTSNLLAFQTGYITYMNIMYDQDRVHDFQGVELDELGKATPNLKDVKVVNELQAYGRLQTGMLAGVVHDLYSYAYPDFVQPGKLLQLSEDLVAAGIGLAYLHAQHVVGMSESSATLHVEFTDLIKSIES